MEDIDFNSSNYILREGVRKIKKKITEIGEENIRCYLEELIEVYDNIIEELEYEERSNPQKVLGITTTY